MRLLRYWIWRRPCHSTLMRWPGSVEAVLAWLLPRSSDQMPSTGLRSGGIGRQEVAGDPVVGIDELPQPAISVNVQVVPDEHDRGAELLVGGDEQVAVVASAAPAVIDVPLGPLDQA